MYLAQFTNGLSKRINENMERTNFKKTSRPGVNAMNRIPKIKSVRTEDDLKLIVEFENNIIKNYDCHQIIHRPEFQPLKNLAFFRAVNVDIGGYGISWNDEIDISEYELWMNGKEIIS